MALLLQVKKGQSTEALIGGRCPRSQTPRGNCVPVLLPAKPRGSRPSPPSLKTAWDKVTLARPSAIPSAVRPKTLNHTALLS